MQKQVTSWEKGSCLAQVLCGSVFTTSLWAQADLLLLGTADVTGERGKLHSSFRVFHSQIIHTGVSGARSIIFQRGRTRHGPGSDSPQSWWEGQL